MIPADFSTPFFKSLAPSGFLRSAVSVDVSPVVSKVSAASSTSARSLALSAFLSKLPTSALLATTASAAAVADAAASAAAATAIIAASSAAIRAASSVADKTDFLDSATVEISRSFLYFSRLLLVNNSTSASTASIDWASAMPVNFNW